MAAHPATGHARRPRLAIGRPLAQRNAEDATSDPLGPIHLPGRTVLTLMAGTAVLALTILSLLIFVGRRPDPRIVASTTRLRNAANT